MSYVLLDALLHEKHSSAMIELAALRPDARPYPLLVGQPTGTIEANCNSIGNQDRSAAFAKHRAFLDLACSTAVELAVTPEYSCPWEVIESALSDGCLPRPGNIWVLGCESITPESLEQFTLNHPDILWMHEDVHASVTRTFLDPICYILNATNANGRVVPLIVVQFKTQHMAEHYGNLERDHLIEGATRFVLRNTPDSIHLTTLICSDTLAFDHGHLIDYQRAPYLILHPQLTVKPYHPSLTQYRYDAFLRGGDHYEVLCVNWARDFHIPGVGSRSHFGASGLYTKSRQLDLRDTTISLNHSKGLYYTRWQTHGAHIYLFNYSEAVFCLQNTKPSQQGVEPVLRKRTGPRMLSIYGWDAERKDWQEMSDVCDGFQRICNCVDQKISPLDSSAMSPVDKERLLCLCSAAVPVLHNKEWYKIDHLSCFAAREDQKIRRMTVIQDPESDEFDDHFAERYRRLNNFAWLRNQILTQPEMFPPCIGDLAANWTIEYPVVPNQYNMNLCSPSRESVATVAFLGDETAERAQSAFDTMAEILHDAQRRLVVWYRKHGKIESICVQAPRLDDDFAESRRSIAREE